MTAGYCGTFVVSCDQVEVDGLRSRGMPVLAVGSVWRWNGQARRMDGPTSLVRLGAGRSEKLRSPSAMRPFAHLLGETGPQKAKDPQLDTAIPEGGVLLTNGHEAYLAMVMDRDDRQGVLYIFDGELPPEGCDLWVVQEALPRADAPVDPGLARGLVCFAAGTMIATPFGDCAIEDLRPGDRIETRDNGSRAVHWAGRTELSAELVADRAEVRPVCIRADALGTGDPERALYLSPDHRVLVSGAHARTLFNTDEVLVAARHLRDDHKIRVVTPPAGITYHHILLEHHEVIRANGLYCESFHPADAELGMLAEEQLRRLGQALPSVVGDIALYGAHARRCLTAPEAAILRHGFGH